MKGKLAFMKSRKKENKEVIIESKASRTVKVFFSVILFIYTLLTIFVLISTLINSFKTRTNLLTDIFGWPEQFTLDAYKEIFEKDNFFRYFFNSMLITAGGTFGNLVLASLTAYGLARFEFKGKKMLSTYFMFGMMFPIQVSILPLFIILRKLSLLNTLPGIILVYASGISLSVMILQKFFRTIPKALDEAARIDGAGEFRIFYQIVLPLCKPVLFTIVLTTAVGKWNDFYVPMVLLGKEKVRTLPLAIYYYLSDFTAHMNVSFAAVVISLAPIIILYFLFSDKLVEGIAGGAVKE